MKRWLKILLAEIECQWYLLAFGLWHHELEVQSFHCYGDGTRRLYRIVTVNSTSWLPSGGYRETHVFYAEDDR